VCVCVFVCYFCVFFIQLFLGFEGTERTVNQTLEAIRLNAAWLARDEKKLQDWLSKQ
jgi:hypothetical protein